MLSTRTTKLFKLLQKAPKNPIIVTDATFQRVSTTLFNQQVDKYHKIITQYGPQNIDIGIPFRNDDLADYIRCYNNTRNIEVPTIYRFIKTPDEVQSSSHYSFMTSLKPLKNKPISERKRELREIDHMVTSHKRLYITGITEFDLDYAIHEICQYHFQYNFDEICLYDICRKLSFEDFQYLIQSIMLFGVPKNKIGLQIQRQKSIEFNDMIEYALQNNIRKYTVDYDT